MPDTTVQEASDLLTPELLVLLFSGEKGALAERLFPYVHTAARQVSSLYHLSPEATDDLAGDALLYAINRLITLNQKEKLQRLYAGFIFTLVRDCYLGQRRKEKIHTDDLVLYDSTAAYDYDAAYADVHEQRKQEALLNREALIESIQHLDSIDRQTLDHFVNHYVIHEDSLEPDVDLNEPGILRASKAAAIRHTALSIGVKPITIYKRLSRLSMHLSELLASEYSRETRN